jgi:hypothetical protein
MIGDWRKLHEEELHKFQSSSLVNISRMIKSRSLRWRRHVAHREEKINAFSVLVRKSE